MITLEKAIQKSMTRPRLSVHHTSFLWVVSGIDPFDHPHRILALSGAALPFSQHLAVKLVHYASEMDNAYSGGPP